MAAARVAHAAHQGVTRVADLARLVAQQAGPDLPRTVPAQLADQAGVGDLGPGHLHQVAATAVQRVPRVVRVGHAALQHHRDRAVQRVPDPPREGGVEHRRGVPVRPVGGGRVQTAAHHDQQVQPAAELAGLRGPGLRRHPGPGRQLITGQPQAQDVPRPDGVPDRGEHLPGQPEPVAAVAVGAVVGQARVELAEQRPGPGVDLHPVGTGRDRQPGRGGEPGGQRVDLRVPISIGTSRVTGSGTPDGPHSTVWE